MWIDNILMITCGWIGGTASALLIRRALDERKPALLDPALLPRREPMTAPPRPVMPHPDFSPYAPKPKRASPGTATIAKVWRATKQERPTSWTSEPSSPSAPPKPTEPPPNSPPSPKPVTDLLPEIPWGQNKPPVP